METSKKQVGQPEQTERQRKAVMLIILHFFLETGAVIGGLGMLSEPLGQAAGRDAASRSGGGE